MLAALARLVLQDKCDLMDHVMQDRQSKTAPAARFSGFVGIDWSGAKTQFIAGVQLAMAGPDTASPKTIAPPQQQHWSRQNVHDFLSDQAAQTVAGAPLLVGIDFAFAHPFADCDSYFPGCVDSPRNAAALWQLVDQVNSDMPHLYGGAMFRHPVWGAYYLAPPNFDASRYMTRRRLTEIVAKASGRSPSPTFKAVGADNVSTGSMAGMRLLHHLRLTLGDRLAIWPFDDFRSRLDTVRLVLVEIFPSYYFYRVGMSPAKCAAAQADFLSKALGFYDSDGVDPQFVAKGADADEADAIIAAAALRYFARPATSSLQTMFDLPDAISSTTRQEGWIFGVDPRNAPSS